MHWDTFKQDKGILDKFSDYTTQLSSLCCDQDYI